MTVDAWVEYWIKIKPLHCQRIMSDMADKGYKTSTIYQTRIALFNMLEVAKKNFRARQK